MEESEGFFCLTHLVQGDAEVVHARLPAGAAAQSGFKTLARQAQFVLLLVNETQIVAERGVVRVGLEPSLVRVLCQTQIALDFIDGAEIVVDHGVLGIELEAGFVCLYRFFQTVELFQNVT